MGCRADLIRIRKKDDWKKVGLRDLSMKTCGFSGVLDVEHASLMVRLAISLESLEI